MTPHQTAPPASPVGIANMREAFATALEEKWEVDNFRTAISDPDVATSPRHHQSEELETAALLDELLASWLQLAKQVEASAENIDGQLLLGVVGRSAIAAARGLNYALKMLENANFDAPTPTDTACKVSDESLAESLSDYIRARAHAYGINPNAPVLTQTLGTLKLDTSGESDYLTVSDKFVAATWEDKFNRWQISDRLSEEQKAEVEKLVSGQPTGKDISGYDFEPDEFGNCHLTFKDVRFEAVRIGLDNSWEVTVNQLTPEQIERVLNLPKTNQEYICQANASELIGFFKRNAPEQFAENPGNINWTATDGSFDYQFEIFPDSDKTRIRGRDLNSYDPETGKPSQIFDAVIEPDSTVRCCQCEIPSPAIEQLVEPKTRDRESPHHPNKKIEWERVPSQKQKKRTKSL